MGDIQKRNLLLRKEGHHDQRYQIEHVFLQELIKRRIGNHLDQMTQDVEIQSILPAGSRLKNQRTFCQAFCHLTDRALGDPALQHLLP